MYYIVCVVTSSNMVLHEIYSLLLHHHFTFCKQTNEYVQVGDFVTGEHK